MTSSVPQTRLQIDRGRYHSTVHGERTPDDPHVDVHFYQDGIPFDAHGNHVDGLLDEKNDKGGKIRALLERRLQKQAKAMAPRSAEEGEGDDDDIDVAGGGAAGDTASDVNLEMWLRGQAQYEFFKVKKAVRDRFHQNFSSAASIVEHLVLEEKIIAVSELAPNLKAALDNLGKGSS